MIGKPPRLAALLLRLTAPPELAGDLDEEFRAGRSSHWYWRQALAATSAGLRRELRRYPLLPIRALVTGWIALTLLAAAQEFVVDIVDRLLLSRVAGWNATWLIQYEVWDVYRVLLWFAATVAIGWVVGRVHRRHQLAAVLTVTMAYAVRSGYYLTLAALDPNLWALQPPLLLVMLTEAAYLSGLLIGGIGLTPAPEPLLRIPAR